MVCRDTPAAAATSRIVILPMDSHPIVLVTGSGTGHGTGHIIPRNERPVKTLHADSGQLVTSTFHECNLLVSSTITVRSLHAVQASGGHTRLWRKILKADLLILDDFGLYPLNPQAAQDLYEIISERYERASIIITSNRAFEEWAEVFNNDLLASAALDRLTHHTHTLTIRGSSYRQRQRRKEEYGTTPALPAESES